MQLGMQEIFGADYCSSSGSDCSSELYEWTGQRVQQLQFQNLVAALPVTAELFSDLNLD